jgi:peroxiredoxin
MRSFLSAALILGLVLTVGSAGVGAEEAPKTAPKIVLKSPDGKQSYDLAKLFADGPVLVRLTCACSGCDQEVRHFQKLQAAYNAKGLQTIAVFKEKPEAASSYVVKRGLKFKWLSDPKGDLWKTFDAKAMPTNILIDKGGKVVKVVPGCTPNGRNAQLLSAEIARLLRTPEVAVVEPKKK